MNVSEQPPKTSGKEYRKRNRQRYYEREMNEIFESWDYHIFEKLKEIDFLLYRMSCEASAMGIPSEYRSSFVLPKVMDMIDQIVEQREVGKKCTM